MNSRGLPGPVTITTHGIHTLVLIRHCLLELGVGGCSALFHVRKQILAAGHELRVVLVVEHV